MALPRLTPNQIEQIARVMGDTNGGSKGYKFDHHMVAGKFVPDWVYNYLGSYFLSFTAKRRGKKENNAKILRSDSRTCKFTVTSQKKQNGMW